jgi:hypothetical protein
MSVPITKTDALFHALAGSPGEPIFLVDDGGSTTHVVISAEAYSRLKALLEEAPFDIRETYAAQTQALAKVWDDPELDLYNQYDQHRGI